MYSSFFDITDNRIKLTSCYIIRAMHSKEHEDIVSPKELWNWHNKYGLSLFDDNLKYSISCDDEYIAYFDKVYIYYVESCVAGAIRIASKQSSKMQRELRKEIDKFVERNHFPHARGIKRSRISMTCGRPRCIQSRRSISLSGRRKGASHQAIAAYDLQWRLQRKMLHNERQQRHFKQIDSRLSIILHTQLQTKNYKAEKEGSSRI
jgi:hypothetical protein